MDFLESLLSLPYAPTMGLILTAAIGMIAVFYYVLKSNQKNIEAADAQSAAVIAGLNHRISKMEGQLEANERTIRWYIEKAIKAEERLALAERENQRLESEVRDLTLKYEQALRQLAEARERIDDLERANIELSRQIAEK